LSKSVYAIIGLGNISSRHRKNLRTLFPDAHIACLSASGRTIDKLPEDCDILVDTIEQMIELKPEFSIIASPATHHARHAIPFLENQIPVLIEKPIAASMKDAELIIEAAIKHTTPAAVAYCLRYKPFILDIKGHLKQKTIGRIVNVEIVAGSYLPDWRPGKNYLESVSALWILGKMDLHKSYISDSKILGLSVEEEARLDFTLESEGQCSIHLDFLQKKPVRYANFHGTNGKIFWNLQHNTLKIITSQSSEALAMDGWNSNDMYVDMLNDFSSNFLLHKSNQLASIDGSATVLSYIERAKYLSSTGLS
jgi:predicted dehydrogenase